MNRAAVYAVILLVGAVAGFFLAGPLVFADGSASERLTFLAVYAGLYLGLGVFFGWWTATWATGLLFAAPALVVALLLGEWTQFAFVVGIVLLLAGGAGGALGARIRARRAN